MRNIPHGHHGTVYYTPSFRPPRRAMNPSKDLPVDLPMFLTRPRLTGQHEIIERGEGVTAGSGEDDLQL